LIITVIAVVLFFVLSPSVLVRLPSKGDKYVVAGTHALVFGILFYFINSLVSFEGFVEGAYTNTAADCSIWDSDPGGCSGAGWDSYKKKQVFTCKHNGKTKPGKGRCVKS